MPRLRDAICDWYSRRYGVELNAEEQAIVTLGSKEDLAHLTLALIKSYLDYGIFTPIQVTAITALEGDQTLVNEIVNTYKVRRDFLCNGLRKSGWSVDLPKATMFVWAKIPLFLYYRGMGSLEFRENLFREADVAVLPGAGFGEYGEGVCPIWVD